MKRGWRIALASTTALVAAGGGWTLYRLRAARTLTDVLPTFTEPAPGPRAPGSHAFGFEVGVTTLAAARAGHAAAGLDCPDTSMRAQMQQLREEKTREVAEVKARGGNVDSVSGASLIHHHSPKEANPQVRLTCDEVSGTRLGDRPRPDARGRLTLVFDSPRHPLRHVSFERRYRPDQIPAALADVADTRADLARRFGPISAPAPGELRWLAPVEMHWRFSDLQALLNTVNWGVRGATVDEVVEVPWPVRADAPAHRLAAR
jgi:hypothetical protein